MTLLESNKTKIAKRAVEVFEFFSEGTRKATVMDIVRRYGRPQSSTSELLSSLVEMGLLYKDPRSRTYSPTPRLAALGISAQPEIIRDGHLFTFMDRLARATRGGVALFGLVGTHIQIFRWSPGAEMAQHNLGCGVSEPLTASTVGLLLLSTFPSEQAGKMLWRLNAEAPAGMKFNPAEIRERVSAFGRQGYAAGPAGFIPGTQLAATLLPRATDEPPLALGIMYPAERTIDADALIATMDRGIAHCAAWETSDLWPNSAPPLMMVI